MKNRFFATTIAAAGLSFLLSGCTTPIADLEVTKFDRGAASNTYGEAVAAKIKAKYAKKVVVTLAPSEEETSAMKANGAYLSDKLTPAITALSYFKVIPTKHLGSIVKMQQTAAATGGQSSDVTVDATDFMITYKLVSCEFTKNKGLALVGQLAGGTPVPGGKIGRSSANAAATTAAAFDTYAKAELNVTLLNVADQSTIDFALVGESGLGADGDKQLLEKAIEDAISKLVAQLAIKFGPPGKVIATKGEGTAVLVNIGKRFGAQVGSTLDFFEYSKDEDAEGLVEVPIASGEIIEDDASYLEDKKCWVRVNKPGLVQKNTLVRLRGVKK
ncbi:MAG: hypothetical protein IJW05_08655 [Lentisphaeria bacterium]|nr:hypothetical protein [Lentisphaeria bacterium]